MTLKVARQADLSSTHPAGRPEASLTAVHTAAQEAEVTVSPDRDPLLAVIAGHHTTADQTRKTPRKQIAERRNH